LVSPLRCPPLAIAKLHCSTPYREIATSLTITLD
jgi:hypothetical protein